MVIVSDDSSVVTHSLYPLLRPDALGVHETTIPFPIECSIWFACTFKRKLWKHIWCIWEIDSRHSRPTSIFTFCSIILSYLCIMYYCETNHRTTKAVNFTMNFYSHWKASTKSNKGLCCGEQEEEEYHQHRSNAQSPSSRRFSMGISKLWRKCTDCLPRKLPESRQTAYLPNHAIQWHCLTMQQFLLICSYNRRFTHFSRPTLDFCLLCQPSITSNNLHYSIAVGIQCFPAYLWWKWVAVIQFEPKILTEWSIKSHTT